MTSQTKKFGVLIEISSDSARELAHKGWHKHINDFTLGGNGDCEMYLEDELSISPTSSPGTSETVKNEVKTFREAETTLNFDDCFVKTSNILHPTVGHSISIIPNQVGNMSYANTVLDNVDTESGFTQDMMPNVDDSRAVLYDCEVVYETPNAYSHLSRERFQGLLDVNQSDEKEKVDPSSQEFGLNSPPKQFHINKTGTANEISEKVSFLKSAISSPIDRNREQTLPFIETHMNKSSLVHSSSKSDPFKFFTDEDNPDYIHKKNKLNLKGNDMNILKEDIYSSKNSSHSKILQLVENPKYDDSRFHSSTTSKNLTPAKTFKQILSPILGSKKKRHLRTLKKSAKRKLWSCTEEVSQALQYQENISSNNNMENKILGIQQHLASSVHLDKLDCKSGEDLVPSRRVAYDQNVLTLDGLISILDNPKHIDDELKFSSFGPFQELTPTKTELIISSPVFGSKQKKSSKREGRINQNNVPYVPKKKSPVLPMNVSLSHKKGANESVDLSAFVNGSCESAPDDTAGIQTTFQVEPKLINNVSCNTPVLNLKKQNVSNGVQSEAKLNNSPNLEFNLVNAEISENANCDSALNSCERSEKLSSSELEHFKSSPILGSKRKRSARCNRKLVKNNLNSLWNEEPKDLLQNNKENAPYYNDEDGILPLLEENSGISNNFDKSNRILPLSELRTDGITTTNLEYPKQHPLLSNEVDKIDLIGEIHKDSSLNIMSFSETRKTSKRKIELQVSYSQSVWDQIFLTQKTLALSCVEDFHSADINPNTFKDISLKNILHLNGNFAEENDCQTVPSLNSSSSKQNDVNHCQPTNLEYSKKHDLSDENELNVSNKLNVSLDSCHLSKNGISGLRGDNVTDISKQKSSDMNIFDVSQEMVKNNNEGVSSQNSISDIVECSQILSNPKFKRKSCLINDNLVTCSPTYSKDISDNFACSKETINANVPLNAKKGVVTSFNESAYIENPSSEDESILSPDKNRNIEEIVSQTFGCEPRNLKIYNTKRKLESHKESNVQIIFPSVPCCSNTTDMIPPVSDVCDVLEDREIVNISVASPETHVLPQEISPLKKMNSQDAPVHISSGSSFDAEQGNVTPPRKTSPVNVNSGKKRKRLKKDGLAAQLQRLLAHKLASVHLCKYELSACIRQPEDSIFLIKKAWLEFNRMLLLCFPCTSVSLLEDEVSENENSTSNNNRSPINENKNMDSSRVIVLDRNIVPYGLIKENTLIRLYAPWQTMYIPRLEITLLLNVTHAELLRDNAQVTVPQSPPIIFREDMFQCRCLGAATKNMKNCNCKLPNQGSGIMKLMFPILEDGSNSHNPVKLMEVVPAKPKCKSGTISEVTKCSDSTSDSNNFLVLKICKIFCYWNSNTDSNNEIVIGGVDETNLIWSLLGEDVNQEQCEIILGSPDDDNSSKEWINIINSVALENIYRFNNVAVVKRMLQGGNDWPPVSIKHQQMFFFIFSVTSGSWHLEKDILCEHSSSPQLNVLLDIFGKCSNRLTILAKPLFIWKSILYITDFSLSSCVDEEICKYLKVNVNLSCYMPEEVSTHVILLQDIVLLKNNLYIDKYCRVYDAEREDECGCPSFDKNDVKLIKNINVQIPTLEVSSQIEDLVSIKGAVIEVDESTALIWPVCKQCDRDLFEQPHHHQLLCEQCGVTEPIMKVSLEVVIEDTSSNICVKVKLLQRTILSLLPGALGETDFEVKTVLHKPLGPLVCIILSKSSCKPSSKSVHLPAYKMLLQEIDLF